VDFVDHPILTWHLRLDSLLPSKYNDDVMTDEELANEVLYRGVFKSVPGTTASFYEIDGLRYTAYKFVRDWRVAGALMEKVQASSLLSHNTLRWITLMRDIRRISLDVPLPRAIIEACVEALGE